jgi:hypothetical protein
MTTYTASIRRLQPASTRRAIAIANARREAAELARLEQESRHSIREARIYRGEIEDTCVDNWHGTDWGF